MKKLSLFLILLGGLIILLHGCTAGTDSVTVPDLTKVLILSNSAYENEFIDTSFANNMTGMQFTSVYTDTMIPTKSFMDSFDVVLLWEDGLTGYADLLGDNVYDYVMGGGNLVLGTWYWQDRSDDSRHVANGWGNLETIDPIMFSRSSMDTLDAYGEDTVDVASIVDNPLTQGVDTLISYDYSGGPDSARSNTTVVARWKQRGIFLAYNKPNGRIVAVSITPADIYYYYYSGTERTGDLSKRTAAAAYFKGFYKVWENALLYSAWGGVRETAAAGAQSIVTNVIGKAKPAGLRKAHQNGSGGHR